VNTSFVFAGLNEQDNCDVEPGTKDHAIIEIPRAGSTETTRPPAALSIIDSPYRAAFESQQIGPSHHSLSLKLTLSFVGCRDNSLSSQNTTNGSWTRICLSTKWLLGEADIDGQMPPNFEECASREASSPQLRFVRKKWLV
jgi:hypothetical protein